jgi:signal transduction histidine kinase
MVGAVVLARPPQARKLDWEDFDLLRVVAQQIATYLAEHLGQQALAEASRFDDFHRRIAFVMHDIKNLSSQLALLARNAERHAENPAFRADMLVTLRNSSDKLNHLVARLSRYGSSTVDKVEPVEVGELAQQLAETFRVRHNVQVIERDECTIAGQRHSIEQILTHLIQNAVDASAPEMPVFVSITGDGLFCRIEIVDSGHGMARNLSATACSNPLIPRNPAVLALAPMRRANWSERCTGGWTWRAARIGTRFIIRLPLASAAEILKSG